VIDRSTTRDTPIDPMAPYKVAMLFGTLVAETILASVHVRAHRQAGHMDASDRIKATAKHLARRGPSTYGLRFGDGATGDEGDGPMILGSASARQLIPGYNRQTAPPT
jgi:hypothetical protein